MVADLHGGAPTCMWMNEMTLSSSGWLTGNQKEDKGHIRMYRLWTMSEFVACGATACTIDANFNCWSGMDWGLTTTVFVVVISDSIFINE